MTYVLNNADVIPAARGADTVKTSNGTGFWQRLFAAMVESRRRSALRELRARHFLTHEVELVLGGFPQTALKSDADLPFNR